MFGVCILVHRFLFHEAKSFRGAASASADDGGGGAAARQAEAEGLTLLKADSNTGYKRVSCTGCRSKSKPYLAQVRRGGKTVHLSRFATAEEAALAYARTPEAKAAVGAAAAAAAVPPAPPNADDD